MLALRLFSTQPFVSSLLSNAKIDGLLKKIYTHSFNQELFSGTLNPQSFGQYLRDDNFYLQHYARILHKLSQKTLPLNSELAKNLSHLSTVIISGEQEMQEQYSEHLLNKASYQPGQTISSYVSFLQLNADKDLPVALISVLPCFWIYYQLGIKLQPYNLLKVNPYQEWIATYTDKGFVDATIQLREVVDQLAEQASPQMQTEMSAAFTRAVLHELEFFNAVYLVAQKHTSKLPCCF